jgi:hypothetical protein
MASCSKDAQVDDLLKVDVFSKVEPETYEPMTAISRSRQETAACNGDNCGLVIVSHAMGG